MPVRMDQPIGWILMTFDIFQVLLTYGKNNGNFTRKPMYIYNDILLNYT